MSFHHGHRGRRKTCLLPGAFDSQLLAYRIGCRDAFPLAVTGATNTAQHGVDLVAIALGIGQAFEHKDRRSFAHHEAISSFGKWACTGRGEGPDFAELDEG